jgi:hypothetical protein
MSSAHALALVLTSNIDEQASKGNLETTFVEWTKTVSSDTTAFEKRDGAYLGIGFLAGCVLYKFGDSWTNVIAPGFMEDAYLALLHGLDPGRSTHLDSCCVALSEATRFCFSLAHSESPTIAATLDKLLELCRSTTAIKVALLMTL